MSTRAPRGGADGRPKGRSDSGIRHKFGGVKDEPLGIEGEHRRRDDQIGATEKFLAALKAEQEGRA